MHPLEQKEAQHITLREMCASCGRPLNKKRGPVTSWLFGSFVCECQSKKSVEARSPEQATQATANQQGVPEITDLQFEFLSQVGSSKYASVWKVRDNATGQIFACKMLNDDVSKNPRTVKRFLQEAEMVEQLNHHNIINVYSKGVTKSGAPYLIMDFIANDSLSTVIDKNGPIDSAQAMGIFIQLCDSLTYAHEHGVIHRSLRPQNVIVAQSDNNDQFIKVTDFGIARALPHPARETIFATGALWELLDPNYSSPELCLGKRIDHRADLFSLGCLMYYMLSGYTVFKGTPTEVILKTLRENPRLLTRRFPKLKLPDGLDLVVMRALEKDPASRYQSAAAIKEDILLIKAGKSPINCRKTIRKGTPTLRLDTMNKVAGKLRPVKKSLVSFEPFPRAITIPLTVLVIMCSLSFGVLRTSLDQFTEPVRTDSTAVDATAFTPSEAGVVSTGGSDHRLDSPGQIVPLVAIKSNTGDRVIFQTHALTKREAVERAVREHVSLENANLTNLDLSHAMLDGAVLSNANLSDSVLSHASLVGADLFSCDLTHVMADGVDMSKADLRRAKIFYGIFTRAKLVGCDFTNCSMLASNFAQANLHEATSKYNSQILNCSLTQADLSNAKFARADFAHSNFAHCNLTQAIFANCNFSFAKIEHAELTSTSFNFSDLRGASFKGSYLDDADLSKALLDRQPKGSK